LERQDLGVVSQAIDHRGGGDLMAEDLTPGAEGLVTGHDQAGALVASGDQHEHQVRGLGIKRDVSSGAKGRRSESCRARSENSRVVSERLALGARGDLPHPLPHRLRPIQTDFADKTPDLDQQKRAANATLFK
jgi:hypothetical protein